MSDFNWPTSDARGRGYNKGGEVKKPMDPAQPRKPKGGADRDPDSNLVFFGKTEDEWKVMSEKAKRRLKLEYELIYERSGMFHTIYSSKFYHKN